jgi:hypothetical protein
MIEMEIDRKVVKEYKKRWEMGNGRGSTYNVVTGYWVLPR